MNYDERRRRTEIAVVDTDHSTTVTWLVLRGIISSHFTISPDEQTIVVTYNAFWTEGLRGFGGVLVARRGRLGSSIPQARIVIRAVRFLLAALWSTVVCTPIKSLKLSAFFDEAKRMAVSRRERGIFGGCWSWPLSVIFEKGTNPDNQLIVVTSRAVYRGPVSGRLRDFIPLQKGFVNCVHISYQHCEEKRAAAAYYLLADGHLHVPDLWLQPNGATGLGAVWSWQPGTEEMQLVVGFINLAGGSASAYVTETKTSAVCYMAADESGTTKCYLTLMADLSTKYVLADLEKPQYVAPTADGRSFLFVDFDGVKRLILEQTNAHESAKIER